MQDSAPPPALEPVSGSSPTEPLVAPERGRARSGFWRELSGALAVGLAVLAAAVLVFQIVSLARGMPGPGLATVLGHVAAAAVAVLAQRFADRRRGRVGVAAVLGVLLITGATLWIFWWA
ncbi:MAG TPA: hypothetical protein VGX25_05345 [Actinophytocola sp.]|uniref:hypothetical protein n=1 Tax=Actinophytocola sp. TaxID=1872138 RepID=UPI002DDCDBC8|nr:hypothetical protein [Actinophytocola sp.]HEV2778807.1 hypothetical protein [Actinophytocola sp.]